MKTEEILQREAEYRAVREAFGDYDVTLVIGHPGSPAMPEAELPDSGRDLVGLMPGQGGSSRTGGMADAAAPSRS